MDNNETPADLIQRWRQRAADMENGDGASRLAAYNLRFAADELSSILRMVDTDLSKIQQAPALVERRFWSMVNTTGPISTELGTPCWNWTGSPQGGYGRFSPMPGKTVAAHRFAYELANGPIADGQVIDHRCHNGSCVNPSHLRAVTRKQNAENRRGANRNSRSGVRGVSWSKGQRRWAVYIRHNNKTIYFGSFDTIEEAEAVAVAKRKEFFTYDSSTESTDIVQFEPPQYPMQLDFSEEWGQ